MDSIPMEFGNWQMYLKMTKLMPMEMTISTILFLFPERASINLQQKIKIINFSVFDETTTNNDSGTISFNTI